MVIGLIADTHGYLGEDAIAALEGCDRILHAGGVGNGVLERLAAVAPLLAVSGNNDTEGEAATLPQVAWLEAPGHRIALVHRLVDAPPEGWDVLVYGHCHRRHADRVGQRWQFNPGAAGKRGFHRERSVARLILRPGSPPSWTFVDLGPRTQAP